MPDNSQVRRQLDEILASKTFANTPRLRQFLQFVVEKSLAGEAEEIKEYVIATEVYGRDVSYNPQIDSTVRVEASRLRSKLQSFYATEGLQAPIEIQLPRGTYVPLFVSRVAAAESEVPPPQKATPQLLARTGLVAAGVLGLLLWVVRTDVQASTPSEADPKVLEVYLRAQKLLRAPVTRDGWPKTVPAPVAESVRLFTQLTKEAPRFQQAWVGLAEAQEWAYELDREHPSWRIEEAKRALHTVLATNPGLADGWNRLASIYFHRTGELDRAEKAARRAIHLNARDVASYKRLVDLLRIRGEFDEALKTVTRAISIEPANPQLWAQRALTLYNTSRYDEALNVADHALQLFAGKEQPLAWWAKGLSLERLGRVTEAEAAYRSGMATHPQEVWSRSSLGHLLGRTGRTKEAEAILDALIREEESGKGIGFQIALVNVGLGRNNDAIAWLERARANRQTSMPFLPLEKRFEPLQDEHRFQSLLRPGTVLYASR